MVFFQSTYKNVSRKSKWLLGACVCVVRAGPAPWSRVVPTDRNCICCVVASKASKALCVPKERTGNCMV